MILLGDIVGGHDSSTCTWSPETEPCRISISFDEISLNPGQSLTADLRVKVTDRLSLSANYEYNFLDNTSVQTGIGMNYKAQCWAFEGRITDTTGVDNSHNYDFEIKVNLFGLGEFGI